MKTMSMLGIAAFALFVMAPASFAGYPRYGYNRGVRIVSTYNAFNAPNIPYDLYTAPPFQYRGITGGYGGTVYGGFDQGNAGYYNYQPGYVVPHGNHLDYIPAHYDFYPNGQYGGYYQR